MLMEVNLSLDEEEFINSYTLDIDSLSRNDTQLQASNHACMLY